MKCCPRCNRVETDETLKFCRVDGATLVSNSSSFASEGATAQLGSQPDTREAHTSILPDNTNPGVNRATGPTTSLPMPSVSATHQFSTTGKRKWLIVLTAAVLLVPIGIAGYWAFERFNAAGKDKTIESIAVLPFDNKSNTTDTDYLVESSRPTEGDYEAEIRPAHLLCLCLYRA